MIQKTVHEIRGGSEEEPLEPQSSRRSDLEDSTHGQDQVQDALAASQTPTFIHNSDPSSSSQRQTKKKRPRALVKVDSLGGIARRGQTNEDSNSTHSPNLLSEHRERLEGCLEADDMPFVSAFDQRNKGGQAMRYSFQGSLT